MSPISEQDLDRLADHAAGLLDPAEAAEVDRLIATQPAWADTFAALSAATPHLDRALAGLAGATLPDQVAARLDQALAAEAAGQAAAADRVQRELPGGDRGTGAGGGDTNVIALRRSRRWTRVTAGGAVAAALIALIVGAVTLSHPGDDVGTATSGAKAPALGAPTGPRIRASGTDYTVGTLPSAAFVADNAARPDAQGPREQTPGESTLGAAPARTPTSSTEPPKPSPGIAPTPAALARLTDPAARESCLTAIRAAEGGTPVALDYALYQGQPALVVVLAGGRAKVVAVGPNCGAPGAGPAEIDRAGA